MKKHILRGMVCLGLIGAALFSLASCALHTRAEELSAGYTRKTSETGEVTDEAFRRAAATFALSLFRESGGEENRLLSPTSALLCFAMLANGTAGTTRTETETALGIGLGELNPALYAYAELLRAAGCVGNASSMWIRDDDRLTVEPSFLQKNADFFAADVYRAAFDKSTVRDINRWVKNRTDGRIKHLLDDLTAENMLCLINALTFDAKWQNPYSEKANRKKGIFTNADGTESDVTYLVSSEWLYLAAEGLQGFMKPYAGGKYRFVALLPDEGRTTAETAAALDGDAWLALLAGASGEKVLTRTPAFEMSARVSLVDALRTMGFSEIFDENRADLSAMGHYGDMGLYCSAMWQDVTLRLDADGTKAAAATISMIDKCMSAGPDETPPHEVYLTRPFLYAIVDAETGLPLFFGTVDRL